MICDRCWGLAPSLVTWTHNIKAVYSNDLVSSATSDQYVTGDP